METDGSTLDGREDMETTYLGTVVASCARFY
jgi:hypothetical protein